MKIRTVLVLTIWEIILLGCAVPVVASSSTQPSPISTIVVEPVKGTPCLTKTSEREFTVTEQSTPVLAPSGTGIAPPGQKGTLGTAASLDSPSPEQIATSQAMTDQSNRNGPGVLTPGPSLPQMATSTPTEIATPQPVNTPQLSDQPSPNETVVSQLCP